MVRQYDSYRKSVTAKDPNDFGPMPVNFGNALILKARFLRRLSQAGKQTSWLCNSGCVVSNRMCSGACNRRWLADMEALYKPIDDASKKESACLREAQSCRKTPLQCVEISVELAIDRNKEAKRAVEALRLARKDRMLPCVQSTIEHYIRALNTDLMLLCAIKLSLSVRSLVGTWGEWQKLRLPGVRTGVRGTGNDSQ